MGIRLDWAIQAGGEIVRKLSFFVLGCLPRVYVQQEGIDCPVGIHGKKVSYTHFRMRTHLGAWWAIRVICIWFAEHV